MGTPVSLSDGNGHGPPARMGPAAQVTQVNFSTAPSPQGVLVVFEVVTPSGRERYAVPADVARGRRYLTATRR